MKLNPNHNFKPIYVREVEQLEFLLRENIEGKETSYWLFVNGWDKPNDYFLNKLSEAEKFDGTNTVYVIDIWDIPNGLNVIRSVIQELRETISTNAIRSYTRLPMLVVLHKAFPRMVDYSGSIAAELGL